VSKVAVAAVLAGLLLCGCDSPRRKSTSAATSTSTPVLGAVGCHPPSPLSAASGLPEVQGTADGSGSLWGLIFGSTPLRVGTQVKIVWRMTGSGALSVVPFGPDGAPRQLAWGPGYHTSSNYHRPGEEWETGLNFDVAGCWRIRLTRTTGRASVYFEVAPKPQ